MRKMRMKKMRKKRKKKRMAKMNYKKIQSFLAQLGFIIVSYSSPFFSSSNQNILFLFLLFPQPIG